MSLGEFTAVQINGEGAALAGIRKQHHCPLWPVSFHLIKVAQEGCKVKGRGISTSF